MTLTPLDRKRLRQKSEIQDGLRLARRTGGCEKCFKPHDSNAPSCNSIECILRWQVREGKPSTPPQEAE